MNVQVIDRAASSIVQRDVVARPRAPKVTAVAQAAWHRRRGAARRAWRRLGTATIGGPSGASSRAPTTPMSAATSR